MKIKRQTNTKRCTRTPKSPNPPKQNGSTLVGVLVALVFIGIVTGVMVKSTASQAGASGSFGNLLTAASTANSGILATETEFSYNPDSALAMINKLINFGDTQAVIGTKSPGRITNKRKLGDGSQYYGSLLVQFRDATRQAQFIIESGKAAGDRAVGGARAFFDVDNIKRPIVNNFPGMNALYVGENAKLGAGNSGMRVLGHATFNNKFLSNQGKTVDFAPDTMRDENGQIVLENGLPKTFGSVYFGDSVNINNGTGESVRFDVPVLFEGGPVDIQNTSSLQFNKNLGIGEGVNFRVAGNVTNQGVSRGDVYMAGKFTDKTTRLTTPLNPPNPDQKFYYTEDVPIMNPAPPQSTCCPYYTYVVETITIPPSMYMPIPQYQNRNRHTIRYSGCVSTAFSIGGGFQDFYPSNPDIVVPSHCTGPWAQPIDQCLVPLPVSVNVQYTASPRTVPGGWNENKLCRWVYNIDVGATPMLNPICKSDGWKCLTHGVNHVETNQLQGNFANYETNNRVEAYIPPNENSIRENVLGTDTRDEPNLGLNNLRLNEADGKQMLTTQQVLAIGKAKVSPPQPYATQITPEILHAAIDSVSRRANSDRYFSDNGHILINVTGAPEVVQGSSATAFDKKAMFIVDGSMAVNNGKFYNSTDNANTVIYVRNGQLQDFGVGAGHLFRGLIYVDENNNKTQTFKWGDDSRIDGAVLLKGGTMFWNTDGLTTIRRDSKVLSELGFLAPNCVNCSSNEDFVIDQPSRGGVILSPIGIYFR